MSGVSEYSFELVSGDSLLSVHAIKFSKSDSDFITASDHLEWSTFPRQEFEELSPDSENPSFEAKGAVRLKSSKVDFLRKVEVALIPEGMEEAAHWDFGAVDSDMLKDAFRMKNFNGRRKKCAGYTKGRDMVLPPASALANSRILRKRATWADSG
jgi:hypothetical protein